MKIDLDNLERCAKEALSLAPEHCTPPFDRTINAHHEASDPYTVLALVRVVRAAADYLNPSEGTMTAALESRARLNAALEAFR